CLAHRDTLKRGFELALNSLITDLTSDEAHELFSIAHRVIPIGKCSIPLQHHKLWLVPAAVFFSAKTVANLVNLRKPSAQQALHVKLRRSNKKTLILPKSKSAP